MLKRAVSSGWSAVMMTLTGALAVARISTAAVGTADDLRSIQNPSWWEQTLAWLLTVPAWIPITAFFVVAVIFTIQLALDAHRRSEALRSVKSSNERAWAFEPEFRATVGRFTEAIADVAETKRTVIEIRAMLESLQKDQDIHRDFLERMKPNVIRINVVIPKIRSTLMNLESEIAGYLTGKGTIDYPSGTAYPMGAVNWARERFTVVCQEAGIDPAALSEAQPHQQYKELRKRRMKISLDLLPPENIVEQYLLWMYRYEQLQRLIDQKVNYDFMRLSEAPLRQSPQDTGEEKPQ